MSSIFPAPEADPSTSIARLLVDAGFCAYFHKPGGCVKAQTCSYCHVCPAGELKRRKQVKMFFRKMMYKIQRQQSGDASQDELQDQDKC
jgi:hypothetical protein